MLANLACVCLCVDLKKKKEMFPKKEIKGKVTGSDLQHVSVNNNHWNAKM